MKFTAKRILTLGSIAVLCAVFISYSKNVYIGSTKTGFNHFPKSNAISPEMALDFAEPFLEFSYNLRKKSRPAKYNLKAPPVEYVVLRGRFYYVTRDSYHSKKASFYMPYAIKVDKNTAKTIKPSVNSKYNSWWQELMSDFFY